MKAKRTCGAKDGEGVDRHNCPALATGNDGLCDAHRQQRERDRGRTAARGYGGLHQQRRAVMIRALFRRPPQDRTCPLCGDTMLLSDRLALDHTVRLVDDPNSTGDRLVHAWCNERRSKVPMLQN